MRSRIELNLVDELDAISIPAIRSRYGERPNRAKRRTRISPPIVTGVVGAIDGIAIAAAGLFTSLASPDAVAATRAFEVSAVCLGVLVAINLLRVLKAYRFEKLATIDVSFGRILIAWPVTAALAFALAASSGVLDDAMWDWLSLWAAAGLIGLGATRVAMCGLLSHWRATGRLRQNIAIVGVGRNARKLLRELHAGGEPNANLVGIFDDGADATSSHSMGHPIRALDSLADEVRHGRVDDVVITLPIAEQWRIGEIVNRLRGLAVGVHLCADEIGFRLGGVRGVAGVTCLNLSERPLLDWRWIAKNAEDRILAALLLLALSPLLLLIAILVKFDSAGPVLFRQRRYGLNNELIEVFKFRTMHHGARDPNCERQTSRDDPRVTSFGKLLRRTSLDELPQLLNVLLGNMSIVGPRPHATASRADGILFEDATRNYGARHRVKPGITGWAQINGWRGETRTIEHIQKRVEYDLYYIENWSFVFDMLIILRTLRHGFVGRQAY